MRNKIFKSHDFTDQAVNDFFVRIDNYCANPDNDIAEVLMEFRLYTERCLQGLYDRMYKSHPYDCMTQMERCTDYERSKIKRIVHKK